MKKKIKSYLILTQSLLFGLAINVSKSSLPRKAGGLSFMRCGNTSSNPTGIYLII